MANNMYVFAKALSKIDEKVGFIRDRADRFAFSQPLWEDITATLTYGEVPESSQWTVADWSKFERERDWQRPSWLYDPSEAPHSLFHLPRSGWRSRFKSFIGSEYAGRVLDAMADCQRLVVCGIEGEILANASGRDFVIVPHGGDIRIAAGLAKYGRDGGWIDALFGSTAEALLRESYRQAKAVVTHGPLRIGGPLDADQRSFADIMPKTKFRRLGLPVFARPRKSKSERRALFAEIALQLGLEIPETECLIFVPSRVDYFWKGQDRLIPALLRLASSTDVHVIFSGWGKDFADLRQRADKLSTTFLPFALSKQWLYKFFEAADLVIDQFVLGHYGTAAQEAMACGAPVMMWIDEFEYRQTGHAPPPVINARSSEDIERAFAGIVAGSTDIEAIGRAGQDWILRQHAPEIVKRDLDRIFSD